jgi:hypothetical protein
LRVNVSDAGPPNELNTAADCVPCDSMVALNSSFEQKQAKRFGREIQLSFITLERSKPASRHTKTSKSERRHSFVFDEHERVNASQQIVSH